MYLYLDDRRTPPKGDNVKSADNYSDFIALIDKYKESIDVLDLDYDLGYDSIYNGLDVLKYIKKYNIICKHINIHSTHPVGCGRMMSYARVNFPNILVTEREIS